MSSDSLVKLDASDVFPETLLALIQTKEFSMGYVIRFRIFKWARVILPMVFLVINIIINTGV
jgi:hypothetical protein